MGIVEGDTGHPMHGQGRATPEYPEHSLNLRPVRTLRRHRPHFIVGAVTASALLTPPDVVSQLLLALPIWVLFEATLVLIGFFGGD